MYIGVWVGYMGGLYGCMSVCGGMGGLYVYRCMGGLYGWAIWVYEYVWGHGWATCISVYGYMGGYMCGGHGWGIWMWVSVGGGGEFIAMETIRVGMPQQCI